MDQDQTDGGLAYEVGFVAIAFHRGIVKTIHIKTGPVITEAGYLLKWISIEISKHPIFGPVNIGVVLKFV